jgi:hypothetical protein
MFVGYTYKTREEAVANSMDFSFTRYEDTEANNGLGRWRYFYRGKEVGYDPAMYERK